MKPYFAKLMQVATDANHSKAIHEDSQSFFCAVYCTYSLVVKQFYSLVDLHHLGKWAG